MNKTFCTDSPYSMETSQKQFTVLELNNGEASIKLCTGFTLPKSFYHGTF